MAAWFAIHAASFHLLQPILAVPLGAGAAVTFVLVRNARHASALAAEETGGHPGGKTPSARALAKAARLRLRRDGLLVRLTPEQAVGQTVSALGAHRAVVNSVTANTVTGMVVTKKRPSILLAIFLFWLCFIPAVIYMINGSKEFTESFALRFDPEDEGTRIVPTGEGRALEAALDALQALRQDH